MNVHQRVYRANTYFKHFPIVESINKAYREGDSALEGYLSELPSNEVLLETLITKLKGKCVYTNLKRISEGRELGKTNVLKALSSLITHIIIECDDHPEYRCVLHETLKRLTELSQ